MIKENGKSIRRASDFYIRGFLGNQVLQSMLAYALSIENNVDPKLVFAFKDANSTLANAKTIFKKEYISTLFDDNLPKRIDYSSSNKTPYWYHGAAELLFKYRLRIMERFNLKQDVKNADITVVHIRASDKQTISNEKMYTSLINEALRNSKTIDIVGDNPNLLSKLSQNDSRINYRESESEVEDWLKLLSASKIYCSPSTFAITPALLKDIQVYILNPNDYTSYPSYLNEYTFIYEASKYFGNIHVLEKLSCTADQNNHISLPNEKLLELLPSFKYNEKRIFSEYFDCLTTNIISEKNRCGIVEGLANFIATQKTIDFPNILKEFIDEFNLDKSYIPNLKNSIESTFMSSKKDIKDIFVPPIIEEYGISIKRHFVYNAEYIIRQINMIKEQNNSSIKSIAGNFMRDGLITIEDFLPTEIYKQLLTKFAGFKFSLSKNNKTLLLNQDSELISSIFLNINFIRFLSLLTGYDKNTIKKELEANTFCQHVKLRYPDYAKDDPQQVFHIDTFYPAFKFWYFPYKVTINDAPFEYISGSHLPQRQLYNHYHQRYLDNIYDRNYSVSIDNKEGSLRLTERDIDRLGLANKKVTVAGNTLVVANVGGLHRRSIHSNNVDRYSIHSSIRPRFALKND